MIKIENVEVTGWGHAIRGMRNPKNSWEKSDSGWDAYTPPPIKFREQVGWKKYAKNYITVKYSDEHEYDLGQSDQKLMMSLCNAGTDHRKFMRMIVVYMDIVAPLYWWKEFDTYKVGTVANSCSTMHKIHAKEFTIDDFSQEHLSCIDIGGGVGSPYRLLQQIIEMLNECRTLYLQTKDKEYWWQMIQLLPGSYNQRRTVMLNYEVLANIYRARKNHKLDEWREFCAWIETLPYSELITGTHSMEGVKSSAAQMDAVDKRMEKRWSDNFF